MFFPRVEQNEAVFVFNVLTKRMSNKVNKAFMHVPRIVALDDLHSHSIFPIRYKISFKSLGSFTEKSSSIVYKICKISLDVETSASATNDNEKAMKQPVPCMNSI